MSGVSVSLSTYLSGKGSSGWWDGCVYGGGGGMQSIFCRAGEAACGDVSIRMFRMDYLVKLPFLSWHAVCMPTQPARHACKQGHMLMFDICTHICFNHVPPTALHMAGLSFPSSTLYSAISLSMSDMRYPFSLILIMQCTIDRCSSLESITESTITLLFCALMQDRLIPCLQLNLSPA